MGRAVDGEQAFARWEAVEAFAMFVREGSMPVWKAHDRHATLMHPGPQASDCQTSAAAMDGEDAAS